MCGVSTFLILSFSMICLCVHKRSKTPDINPKLETNQNVALNNRRFNADIEISQNVSTERETGNDYEEIDERKMSDFYVIVSSDQGDISDHDNSSESSDGIVLPCDGYLNPYQQLQSTLHQSEHMLVDPDEYSNPCRDNTAYTNLYQSLNCNTEDTLIVYSRCRSVHYIELLDEPIGNENVLNIKIRSKRYVKTL